MIPLVFSLTGLVEVIFGVFIRKSFWRLSKTENLITHYRPGLSGGRVTQLYLADITGAEVSSSRDSDGDRTYRVAFTTKSGDRIPMTSWYSSGYQRKQDTATLICDFISHT